MTTPTQNTGEQAELDPLVKITEQLYSRARLSINSDEPYRVRGEHIRQAITELKMLIQAAETRVRERIEKLPRYRWGEREMERDDTDGGAVRLDAVLAALNPTNGDSKDGEL